MNPEHTALPEPPSEAEIHILLRSTGELGADECAALDQTLAKDTQLAEYAHFINCDLTAAATSSRDFAAEAIGIATVANTPRDFAAEAIATVASSSSARHEIPFPTWRKYAYSAAAAACLFLTMFLYKRDHELASQQQVAVLRITEQISYNLNDLDSEISASSQRIKNGRFHRSTTQL